MANVFLALPVPAANGVGAWVDVSSQGPERTVVVDGTAFDGVLTLEGSNDAQASAAPTLAPAFTSFHQAPATFVQAFNFLRVRRAQSSGVGAPTVNVSAPAAVANVFAALAVPVGDGLGAPTSIAGGGDVNTVQVVGAFTGTVEIEASNDGVNFTHALLFTNGAGAGQQFQGVLSALRVRRRGTTDASTPLVSVGSSATTGAAGAAFPGYGGVPPAVGTGAAGVSVLVSRADHTHDGVGSLNALTGAVTIDSPDASLSLGMLGSAIDIQVNSGLAGADTSALPTTMGLAWLYAPGKLLPTNNQDPRACNAVCAVTAAGAIRIEGPVELPFTTLGGKPTVGAPAYVSASTEDVAGDSAGKCTATKPGIGLPPSSQPPRFPQNPARVGTVLNNDNYDTLKTCRVLLSLPAPFEVDAEGADQNWSGAEIANLSGANNLRLLASAGQQFRGGPPGGGTVVPGTDPTLGATMIVWYTNNDDLTVPPTGNEDLFSCAHFDGLNGWAIQPFVGGVGRWQTLSAAGALTGSIQFGNQSGIGLGVQFLAISVRGDGTVAGVKSGKGQTVYGSWTAIVLPDAGNRLCIGGGYLNGTTPGFPQGGVIGVAMLGRPWSDAEMQALNAYTSFNPPASTRNPWTLPPAVLADPSRYFSWLATDWDGSSATVPADIGPLGTAFNLTVNGATTKVNLATTWKRSLAPFLLDTKPIFYDARGYPNASAGARVAFTVATQLEAYATVVGWTVNDWDDFDNSSWCVRITPQGGTNTLEFAFPAADIVGTIVDGNIHYFTVGALVGTDLPPAASFLVEIIGADRIIRSQTFESGSNLTDVVVPSTAIFQTNVASRRLVLVAADEMIGHDSSSLGVAPMSNSAASLFRLDYPGRVALCASSEGGIAAELSYGNGSMEPWANRVNETARSGGLPARLDLVFMLGFFSDYFATGITVANYITRYGQLLDFVRALLPESPGGVAHYQLWKSIQVFYDALGNSNGQTLSQFDAAVDVVASTRPWVTVHNVRGPNAIAFSGAAIPNAQPQQTGGGGAGSLALKNNGKLALGY